MKTFLLKHRVARTCKNSRGFTLIEILVVMAIIGILLAIAVPAILGVINIANRAKDKANATNVKVAVLAYNSDYGALPVPAGVTAGSDFTLGPALLSNPTTAPGAPTQYFFNGLCGNSNASVPATTPLTNTGINTRNIPYLNLTKSQVDANGILIQAFKINGSPTYFSVMLDGDYNNTLTGIPDPNSATDGATTMNINDVCAVWCNNDQTYNTAPNIRWSTTY